jgi:4-diphosphocytidyl-2-C-methyl-D-erythritol kinase
VSPISIFAPAKLNLFLAITGRRSDGFHELVSVVAQLAFGDTLRVDAAENFSLEATDPELVVDRSNLVLRAADAFAAAAQWTGAAAFRLEKQIPVGAGLGGGSSDAVAALRALNQLVPGPHKLSTPTLATVASKLGSDCPLFLHEGPVVMRGRGERIEPLPSVVAARLRGRRVLLFKPGFGVSTAWAYGQLSAGAPATYVSPEEAESRLAAWIGDSGATAESLAWNTLEPPVMAKFMALPALIMELERRFGLKARMSGSGSACFAFLADDTDAALIIAAIHECWGQSAFVLETRLL